MTDQLKQPNSKNVNSINVNYAGAFAEHSLENKDFQSAYQIMVDKYIPVETVRKDGSVAINPITAQAAIDFQEAYRTGQDPRKTSFGTRLYIEAGKYHEAMNNSYIVDIMNSQVVKPVLKDQGLVSKILETDGNKKYGDIADKLRTIQYAAQDANTQYERAIADAKEDQTKIQKAQAEYGKKMQEIEKKQKPYVGVYTTINSSQEARFGITRANLTAETGYKAQPDLKKAAEAEFAGNPNLFNAI